MKTNSYIHLAIDYQEEFLRLLPDDRRAEFIKAARIFSNQLHEIGIPTLWVAYGKEGEDSTLHHPRINITNRKDIERYQEDVRRLGISSDLIKDWEQLHIKGQENAFQKKGVCPLADHLNELNIKTVLISGMDTKLCVASTLWGARRNDFKTIAVYDQMASEASPEYEQNPMWHITMLKHFGYRNGIYKTKNEIITELTPSPNIPIVRKKELAPLRISL